MNFETALLAAVGGLVTSVVFLVGGIVYLYKRDIRRQQSSELKVENIRKGMELRLETSERHCQQELKQARADISRLSEDVSKLSQHDRDVSVAAIMLYAEKREVDRALLVSIAKALGVEVPPVDPNSRTTVSLRALTGVKR